eukprot:485111_1
MLSVLLIAIYAFVSNAQKFSFGNTQGSNMVLQQSPHQAKIWGNATVGASIKVILTKESDGSVIDTQSATTASNGLWSIYFKRMVASSDSYNITATDGTNTISMTNILFGDVFICSGQSNMQFSVSMAFNATAEIAAANNYPMIRLFTAKEIGSPYPVVELLSISETWSVANSKTVGGPDWNYMSAACWFFGRDIYEFKKYPIGLIGTDYGGTPVRFWSSPDALAKCNESVSENINEPNYDYKKYSNDKNVELADSQLWNAQIYPFLQTTIKGAIWYQGESDCGAPYDALYACAFPAMISDWRQKWALNSNTSDAFPFGYVHLSTWGDGTNNKTCGNNIGCTTAGIVRWGQSANYGYIPNKIMPNTFMATAIDLGDPTSPYGDIHPRYKQQVGKRLSTAAKSVVYGQGGTYWQGPIAMKATVSGNNIIVTFGNEGGKGLTIKNSYGFEVYDGTKNTWDTTTDEIKVNGNNAVTIAIPSTVANAADVKQIRYGWFTAPCFPEIGPYNCAIYDTAYQLPAIPFLVNVTAS